MIGEGFTDEHEEQGRNKRNAYKDKVHNQNTNSNHKVNTRGTSICNNKAKERNNITVVHP